MTLVHNIILTLYIMKVEELNYKVVDKALLLSDINRVVMKDKFMIKSVT